MGGSGTLSWSPNLEPRSIHFLKNPPWCLDSGYCRRRAGAWLCAGLKLPPYSGVHRETPNHCLLSLSGCRHQKQNYTPARTGSTHTPGPTAGLSRQLRGIWRSVKRERRCVSHERRRPHPVEMSRRSWPSCWAAQGLHRSALGCVRKYSVSVPWLQSRLDLCPLPEIQKELLGALQTPQKFLLLSPLSGAALSFPSAKTNKRKTKEKPNQAKKQKTKKTCCPKK